MLGVLDSEMIFYGYGLIMKRLFKKSILSISVLLLGGGSVFCQNSLPPVFSVDQGNDIVASILNLKAEKAFEVQQVPDNKTDWIKHKEELRATIIEKANVAFFHDLPLGYRETGRIKQQGYTIRKIYFQTRPNVYATANLYVPDGEGPFPGVVTMMGHSSSGKLADAYQSLGHTLALNGYVSVNIDPWGAGERATGHGAFEYHGASLGASLMNVGETLMGLQITDNMRAVDLLVSLPFVDPEKIGATGASGGGNQTMWLAAMDERVKAAVPVVSVGTFQSYVMNSNCICETLIDGLTFTEESSVLGLIAPRALKICNGEQDSNRAFYPREMLRSFQGARTVYRHYEAEDKLSYEIFDTPHGYYPVMREAMLGWFDLYLKNSGDGTPKSERPFSVLPESELMVFNAGERPREVVSTADFCYNQGISLKEKAYLMQPEEAREKREILERMLRIPDSYLHKVHVLTDFDNWERRILETTSGGLIPVLVYLPNKSSKEYVVMSSAEGKNNLSEELIRNTIQQDKGLCIVDLWGIGECNSFKAEKMEGSHLPPFHTLSRSALWLGTTVQGIWINQLNTVTDWLRTTYHVQHITVDADKETAIAGLLSATIGNVNKVVARNMPLSYLFDKLGKAHSLSMAWHIPAFLEWGDLSLAAALSDNDITVVNPVSMSGRELNEEEIEKIQSEFNHFKSLVKSQTKLTILNRQ